MIGNVLGALIVAATCVCISPINALTNKCPPADPEIDILLPHENNCSKFYICSHGVPIELQCPEDLYFNPIQRYCDYQSNVKCGHNFLPILDLKISQETMPISIGSHTIDRDCPLENSNLDVLYPHEFNCGEFYKCDNGKKILQQCPHGLFYNPAQSYCDWPKNVNCVNSNSALVKLWFLFKGRTVDSDRFCPLENPDKDILHPHESNCSLFYKCFNGHLVPHACPPNLYYNPDREYCDWPSNVKCSIESQTEATDLIDCPIENPEQDILYPHESKCNVFYKCSNGEKIPFECLPGLYFNPKKNLCDWPENVACVK